VPSSGKKSSFNQEQRGLTKLQKDGIKKRLANNPVVEFVGIKLMEVAPGRSNLVGGPRAFQSSLASSAGAAKFHGGVARGYSGGAG
jgi:hypothetical protein